MGIGDARYYRFLTRAWTERMSKLSEPKPLRKRQSKSTRPEKAMTVSEHEVRDAAYYLWEEEGRPEGRALDHWLRVSGRLLACQGKMPGG
jgi:hypothetical protein